jgi:hypothetical protein
MGLEAFKFLKGVESLPSHLNRNELFIGVALELRQHDLCLADGLAPDLLNDFPFLWRRLQTLLPEKHFCLI